MRHLERHVAALRMGGTVTGARDEGGDVVISGFALSDNEVCALYWGRHPMI